MTQSAIRLPEETTFNLRIDSGLKADFAAAAEAEDRAAADVVRSLMRGYVEETRKRRFAAEARRQSQLIANSAEEQEVLRWIEHVSAPERGQ